MLMTRSNASSRNFSHKVIKKSCSAKPYCHCWNMRGKVPRPLSCTCGEEYHLKEWRWKKPSDAEASEVVLSDDNQVVMFNPRYSLGTAAVRGDTPMYHNCHYYWEIKMLTDTYGTDIMLGIGSSDFDLNEAKHKFTSLLGQDRESYGLSYTGHVQHNSLKSRDSWGFCKGSIVGLRLNMWQGTLEFYINRQLQGEPFYNLRRHSTLYPMACSTTVQSCMKLIYSSSWRASLMVDAMKILSSAARKGAESALPPGLLYQLKPHFWLSLSSGVSNDDDYKPLRIVDSSPATQSLGDQNIGN